MGDVARPQSYQGDRAIILRRIAALERAAAHPGVDPSARISAGLAAALADNAAVVAANTQVIADNAETVAAAAEAAATAAQTTASGKNTIYRQDTAPTGGTYAVGDLWFDTANGNAPHVWDGTAWITAQDAAIAEAQGTALAAQTSANGKNKIFVQSTTPTATAVGDTWIDTGNANQIKTWDGATWAAKVFGTAAIASGAITDTQIATATISSAKILGLDGSKITGNLDGSKVTGGTITAAQLASGSVTSAQIANSAVIAGKVAAGAIVAGTIAADAVTANEIAANAITATEIAAGAVIAGKVAANAITANAIEAGAVAAGKIAAGAVTAGTIDAGAVTAGTIAAGAVTTTTIAANAITAAKINAGTITATEIATGAITSTKISAGAVTATEIAAGAVIAAKIDVDAMTAKNLYTAAAGTNRIIMGPTAYYTEPRIVFDVDGNGASANDPSIRGAATGLMIHGGTNAGNATSINMAAGVGQADRITLTAQNSTRTITATLDASQNSFAASTSITSAGNVSTGNGSYFVMGSTVYNATVGSAPNVHVVPGSDATQPYALRRSSYVVAPSSARFKTAIEPLTADALDPARLLALPVRQFRYREEHEPWPEHSGRLHPGFIAEEIDQVYPAATHYDTDGTPLNYYERALVPGMLALIQQQHARITALEKKLK